MLDHLYSCSLTLVAHHSGSVMMRVLVSEPLLASKDAALDIGRGFVAEARGL